METVKGPDSLEKEVERMVGLYQLPLLRLCYAYLHDEDLAKDAVQETFIKAYRNLGSFRRTHAPEENHLRAKRQRPDHCAAALHRRSADVRGGSCRRMDGMRRDPI